MEWYFGNDNDLVVPKDQEQLDRLPSPASWSQWGVAKLESSESPNKHFFNGKSFGDEVDVYSGHERERPSNPSTCRGFHNCSLPWAGLSREQHECQLNNIAAVNQMDDIFLSSLLEEDNSSTDHLHGSSSFSAKSNFSMMSADNYMPDMMTETEYMPSHTYGMGSSRYLKTHAFSPSVEWENGDVDTSCPQVKVESVCLPFGQDDVSRYVEEETSLEESVLQELERVTSQLTEQTRTCFRDALYRLAENSKQEAVNSTPNGDHVAEEDDLMMVDDETLRLSKTKANESKTNAIDRAIANLMFNKMEHFSAEDLSAGSSFNFKQEANETTTWQFKYNSNHIQTRLSADAEVPIVNQDNPQRYFSTTALDSMLSYC